MNILGKLLLAEVILHTLSHIIGGTGGANKLIHLTLKLEIELSDFNWIMCFFS